MKRPWMKFYPSDWQADETLGSCGLAARGLWVEMMALMHKAEPYGHLLVNGKKPSDDQIAALARAPAEIVRSALLELESAGVFSRTRNGTIFSRRMTRDERRSQEGKLSQQEGGPLPGSRRSRQVTETKPEKVPPPGVVGKVADKSPSTQMLDASVFKNKNKMVESEFEEFWKAWPDKAGSPRKTALAAFGKARSRVEMSVMLAGLEAYKRWRPTWQHWVGAAVWLNQDRWANDYSEPTGTATAAAPLDQKSAIWRAKLAIFQKSGAWEAGDGASPAQPGCRVPPDILAEFPDLLARRAA
jgi:hypothetical protein